MNKYTLGKQKTLAELCEAKDCRIKKLENTVSSLEDDLKTLEQSNAALREHIKSLSNFK